MSDVLIKGMEMPKDCDNCRFYNDDFDYANCEATGSSRGYTWHPFGQRMPNCPLVEVPTPHGRLIDVDRLIRELKNVMSENDLHFAELAYIVGQPTIIEAEDGT